MVMSISFWQHCCRATPLFPALGVGIPPGGVAPLTPRSGFSNNLSNNQRVFGGPGGQVADKAKVHEFTNIRRDSSVKDSGSLLQHDDRMNKQHTREPLSLSPGSGQFSRPPPSLVGSNHNRFSHPPPSPANNNRNPVSV